MVATWLSETVGLAQYRAAFEGNDINGQCLIQLTKDDLKTELGVSNIHLDMITKLMIYR